MDKLPCCGAKVQQVYGSATTKRVAHVYICLACDRLCVEDSRDANTN